MSYCYTIQSSSVEIDPAHVAEVEELIKAQHDRGDWVHGPWHIEKKDGRFILGRQMSQRGKGIKLLQELAPKLLDGTILMSGENEGDTFRLIVSNGTVTEKQEVYLFSSPVLPAPGLWRYENITEEEFRKCAKKAISVLGDASVAEMFSSVLGWPVPVSAPPAPLLLPGDRALLLRQYGDKKEFAVLIRIE